MFRLTGQRNDNSWAPGPGPWLTLVGMDVAVPHFHVPEGGGVLRALFGLSALIPLGIVATMATTRNREAIGNRRAGKRPRHIEIPDSHIGRPDLP